MVFPYLLASLVSHQGQLRTLHKCIEWKKPQGKKKKLKIKKIKTDRRKHEKKRHKKKERKKEKTNVDCSGPASIQWGIYNNVRDLASATKAHKPSWPNSSPTQSSKPQPTKSSSVSSSTSKVQQQDRPLILYAYHESDSARANLKFFVNEGLSGAADFVFIINGETEDSALVPRLPHIRVVERPNTCYDLGSFGEVLRAHDLYKKYKRFITINASVRGPFVPRWATGKTCWMDAFLNRLSDTVKVIFNFPAPRRPPPPPPLSLRYAVSSRTLVQGKRIC